jgi:hypothetical protein
VAVRTRALIGLGLVALLTTAVHAAEAPWQLIQTNDGTLYVVAAGLRHRIMPATVPDEAVTTIPEGDAWTSGAMADTPAVPLQALTLASAPLAAPTQANGVIELEGDGTQTSRQFHLSGGNYLLRWTATPKSPAGCYYGGALQAREYPLFQRAIANEVVKGGARRAGEARLYALKPGDYFLNVSSSCDWNVSVIPQL